MKNPALLPFPVLMRAACATMAKHEAKTTAGPALPFEIIGAVLVDHHIE